MRKIEVLKKHQFQVGSGVTLPVGNAPVVPVNRAAGRTAGGPAQVRIVESNSDYAILEIVCGCGQKSFVQCNYGNVTGGG